MRHFKIIFVTLVFIGIYALFFRTGNTSGAPTTAQEIETRAPAEDQRSVSKKDSVIAPTATERVEAQTLLKEGFELADRASDGDRAPLNAYLERLDRQPELARLMITEGLASLPKNDESAMQRAGLLDLVPRFASGNERWAIETLESELVSFPSEARITQKAAATRDEMNTALTVTPDILRTHLAFENLVGLLKRDCPELERVSGRILESQKDQILRENFRTRVQYECPSTQVSFHQSNDQGAAQ